MLSHVLEEGVCGRSVLLVHLWLKAAAHTQLTQKRPRNTFFLEINVASRTRDRKMWPSLLGLQVIHNQTNPQRCFVKAVELAFYRVRDRQKGHSRCQVLLESETSSSTGDAQHLPVWRKSNNVQFHLAAGKISFVMIKPCLQLQVNGKLTVTREVTTVHRERYRVFVQQACIHNRAKKIIPQHTLGPSHWKRLCN